MNKTIATVICAVLLSCFSSSSVGGEKTETQIRAEDEAALRKRVIDGIERFNRKELAPIESYFTPDADFVNVYGTWMKGVAEIERLRKVEVAELLKDAKISLIDYRIRFVRPDVAIVIQEQVTSGKRSSKGEELPPERQVSTRVLVKEQGKWLTTSFQNTSVRPTGSPATTK